VADKLGLLLVLLAVASLAGYLGRLHFFFELASHFRAFYLFAALLLTLALLPLRSWKRAAAGALLVLLNAAPILPYYWHSEPPAGIANLRVLESNVLTSNRQCDLLLSRVRTYRPDVIFLIEVDKPWLSGIADLKKDYPYTASKPRRDNFGIALLSRYPFRDLDVFALADTEATAIKATLVLGEREVTCFAVHAFPPGTPKMTQTRDVQLLGAATLAKSLSTPIVVCGDFNATPWSPVFGDVLSRSGLKDARRGFGVIPTWPTQYWPLMIPIDHCLVSPSICVKSFQVLSAIGSDHLPILVDLSVPAPRHNVEGNF
jgi:endonuclease/exonuclease/phosphatase (EEP) superfamily protein YafD